MDVEEFRRRGKEMVDYAADYLSNIRGRTVYPSVKPGYLKELVPDEPPQEGESWDDVMSDVERVVMPGVVHWQHPSFHAYFAAGNSFPSILGDLLSNVLGNMGFTWAASPVCTELEKTMVDWLAKMLGLPEAFSFSNSESGGGSILVTCSEATAISLLAAKRRVADRHQRPDHEVETKQVVSEMVGYHSDQAHSSVVKAGLVASVRMVAIESDDNFSMKPEALEKAICEDIRQGRVPAYCCATLGTTPVCSFDKLHQIGPICKKYGVWLHVDAAYAGSAFVCPEYKDLLTGVEHADSFCFNMHKWMLTNFDCAVMWVKDVQSVTSIFHVDTTYYIRDSKQPRSLDYRHWQIADGRRFRALKVWFVLRSYGVLGIQAHIRKHVALAKEFERLVRSDAQFEIVAAVVLGLVCFRLKGPNELNERLLQLINNGRRIHLVPATAKGVYFLRFALSSNTTESKDIEFAWEVIGSAARVCLEASDN